MELEKEENKEFFANQNFDPILREKFVFVWIEKKKIFDNLGGFQGKEKTKFSMFPYTSLLKKSTR